MSLRALSRFPYVRLEADNALRCVDDDSEAASREYRPFPHNRCSESLSAADLRRFEHSWTISTFLTVSSCTALFYMY